MAAFAGPPGSVPAKKSSQAELAERQRFLGNWHVGSATFQMSGPINYIFTDDMVVVETCHIKGGKEGRDGPITASVERFRYRLDMTPSPKQIFLTNIASGKTQRWAYDFRGAWLLMCMDDGPKPMATQESLDLDKFGGWRVGLQRK
jgi:hypothetical protein